MVRRSSSSRRPWLKRTPVQDGWHVTTLSWPVFASLRGSKENLGNLARRLLVASSFHQPAGTVTAGDQLLRLFRTRCRGNESNDFNRLFRIPAQGNVSDRSANNADESYHVTTHGWDAMCQTCRQTLFTAKPLGPWCVRVTGARRKASCLTDLLMRVNGFLQMGLCSRVP